VRDVGGPEALALVLALLDAAESETDLVAVAAGPLEDLMQEHGADVMNHIETGAGVGRHANQYRQIHGGSALCWRQLRTFAG